ncbi:CoA-binding protein [Xenophilus aerolatus]|nr:CoA-binding protein [Xenophilus aerolatus]
MVPQSLEAFFSPRSIAIVGASGTPGKIGAYPLHYQRHFGYAGALVLVNPGRSDIDGIPCVPSLRVAQEELDLAILAVPADQIEAAVDDAIAARVRNVVMFSAGFAETGGAGAELQRRVVGALQEAGIRLLGPNCLGYVNVAQSIYATFSPAMMTARASPGHVAVVSQSGAFGGYAYAMACRRDLGLSHWITTGNEADLHVADCIEWLAGDERTRVILAYMEGCGDGERFVRSLQAARAAGKPVVVIKVGATARGASAASSHSAALAADDRVFDAVLRQYGAWRVGSIEELFNAGYALSTLPRPSNQSLGVLTVSGGVGALVTDYADGLGVAMPPMPDDAQRLILEQVPFAAAANPVDITAQVMHRPELLVSTARLMLDKGGYGSLLVFLANGVRTEAGWQLQRDLAATLRRDFPDRAIVFSALSSSERTSALDAWGCASFEDPSAAVRAIAALSHFAADLPAPPAVVAGAAHGRARSALNELEAMDLLRDYGISTPAAERAATALEAVEAARRIGFPVVLKVLSAEVQHKTEIGGVVLDVADEAAVESAFSSLGERWNASMSGRPFEGVVVASMVSGGVECLLGLHRDPQFGLVAVFGMGGVQAELLADVTVRRLPLTHTHAREMMTGLKSSAVFSGFRGAAPLDVAALERTILALGRFGENYADELESVDLNPLLVRPEGKGAVALDAVIQWRR